MKLMHPITICQSVTQMSDGADDGDMIAVYKEQEGSKSLNASCIPQPVTLKIKCIATCANVICLLLPFEKLRLTLVSKETLRPGA